MEYKNGYKVVYEVAADGKRTFYAATSNEYPTRDEAGNITDDVVASFVDADFLGKTVYEYKGKFYVSAGSLPAYNEDGTPAAGETELNFDLVLKEAKPATEGTEDSGTDNGDDDNGNDGLDVDEGDGE
jgi:hypothetical protein